MLVALSLPALAGGVKGKPQPGIQPVVSPVDTSAVPEHLILNNVVKWEESVAPNDSFYRPLALCTCGKKFKLMDENLKAERSGTTYYLCSAECQERMAKATPEEEAKSLAAWKTKYETCKLQDDTYMKDGQVKASCICALNFPVTDHSPTVCMNGAKLYFCSNRCCERFRDLGPNGQSAVLAKGMRLNPHPGKFPGVMWR